MRQRPVILLALALLACACPNGKYVRQGPAPDADELIAHIHGVRDRVRNLRTETKTDVRLGEDRVNVKILIMVAWGGKLRYQAMNPNESLAADLASDGTQYCFIDAQHNCGECGPATPENVGRMLRVVMEPDEVVAMMFGGTPVLEGANAKVTWDAESGREIIDLSAGEFTQRIALDGRERRWDVLESEVKGPGGKRVWKIQHKYFHDVKLPDGSTVRLPGKSWFEQPGNDVLIEWRDQELNVEINEARAFTLQVPAGLPVCTPP